MGRVNFGAQKDFEQHKGLLHTQNDTYSLNGQEIAEIEIISLEFKSQWVKRSVRKNHVDMFFLNYYCNCAMYPY